MTLYPRRLASIDAFRGITMLLMVFVNDLPSLKEVPAWLEHAGEMEDGMGLADMVFPAFLFIVGLSIPFAMASRRAKGQRGKNNFLYIITRSLALLVMGIFQVNYESYNGTDALIPKYWWLLIVTLAFFLVWLDYPGTLTNRRKWLLRGGGIFVLLLMALLYEGGQPGKAVWMQAHWYGILGLIGWCYLLCAIVYLWMGDRFPVLLSVLFFFLGFTIADKAGWLHFLHQIRHYVWIIDSGALPFLTMGGVVTAVLYRKAVENGKLQKGLGIMMAFGLVMLAGGFALRPFWGISKLGSTPSWIMICMAISLACFVALAYIMDIKGRREWYRLLRPAGTSALTCYLLPYIHFAIYHLLGNNWRLPETLRTGGIGLLKSICYAFLIVLLTGLLEKKRIRLSI